MAPTPLDFEQERHEGAEPRVVINDVKAVLRRIIQPEAEGSGESVSLIAEKAKVSTRTVYRVLEPEEGKDSITLDLADRLCIAADAHLSECRLRWPDGTISPYVRTHKR